MIARSTPCGAIHSTLAGTGICPTVITCNLPSESRFFGAGRDGARVAEIDRMAIGDDVRHAVANSQDHARADRIAAKPGRRLDHHVGPHRPGDPLGQLVQRFGVERQRIQRHRRMRRCQSRPKVRSPSRPHRTVRSQSRARPVPCRGGHATWPASATQAITIATRPVIKPNSGIPSSATTNAATAVRFQRRGCRFALRDIVAVGSRSVASRRQRLAPPPVHRA